MFTFRQKRLYIVIFVVFAVSIIICLFYFTPLSRLNMDKQPAQAYDYYYIYAEEDGRELMRVPVDVSANDELITEDNKRYKVIKVEGNKGVARYVEDVNIEQYKLK